MQNREYVITEQHGGSISAHSEGKGKGATFSVRLPLLRVPALEAMTAPAGQAGHAGIPDDAQQPAAAPASIRILLVEDHLDTAHIMRRVLAASGHQVQIAADVATALKLATDNTFDLLLSDLGLPDGSGLDLIRELRARGFMPPAIALSGYGQDTDFAASCEAGFINHLVKPVSLPRLTEAIARAVS